MGLATAQRIVEEGGRVIVTGTSQAHIDAASNALSAETIIIKNDAGDPDAAQALADQIKDQVGQLDGLYLNAGIGTFSPVDKVDADFFDRINNINVRGPVLQMAHLKGLMNEGGAVLLTASSVAYLGQAHGAVYAGTKSALTAIARAWANDMVDRNIRVNSIAPGPVDTHFGGDHSEKDKRALQKKLDGLIPMGRSGTAEEVAAVACFLLSSDASFVTGSQYTVDGGVTLR